MRSERRRAREAAMRALYQMDMSGCTSEDAISYAVSSSSDLDLPERAQGYASQLVCAAVERMTEIDAVMAGDGPAFVLFYISLPPRTAWSWVLHFLLNKKKTKSLR